MANLEKLKDTARKHEMKEQWPKAIEILVKAVEEFEKSPDNEADLALYNRLGDLYVKVNDTTNAIQYYERAVDRYAEAGLVNPAIAVCNKVLRLSPGRASTYLKLGVLFAKKGFAAEAKQNLLEYADRMQKAGQIEEAFKALKKFAEMTPGQQDEIWAVLAQQARAQAKTPEAQEQVDKLLAEFEAKDKAATQRRSRMSRSMVTGEEIPEDKGPKKGELIFLDIDDVPTPGRRSGSMPRPSVPTPPPPPPPRATPPAEIAPLPMLEIETTSMADDLEPPSAAGARADTGESAANEGPPMLDIEPTAMDIEPTSIVDAGSLGIEPTAVGEGAGGLDLDLEPTSTGPDLGGGLDLEPTSLGLEPTSFDAPAPEPDVVSPLNFDTPSSPPDELPMLDTGYDSGNLDLPGTVTEPDETPSAEPMAGLPMLDLGDEPAAPPAMEPAAEFEMMELTPAVASPAEASAADVAAAENEAAQKLEFMDLGAVAAPLAPSVGDLEAQVAAHADDWEGHRLLGESLIERGEREKGLAELDVSLAGYDGAEDLASASALVDEILRLDPNSVRHQQKRVELAYRSGDRSRLVDAYVELADALLRSNEPGKSVAVYQRVLEHDPDNARARSALETLEPPPPPAPPVEQQRKSTKAPTPEPVGGFMDLGAFLLDEEPVKDTRMRIEDEEPTGDEQKDFQQMLSAFKKGIDANVADEDFQSHYDLGVAYKEMGLLDEAISEFQKALRGTDGKLKSSEALGLCFFEKGQFAVAETILRRGLELPAHGDAERVGLLYWFGRALEEQRKNRDALEAYNRVFGVDINFADVNQRVQSLAKAGV